MTVADRLPLLPRSGGEGPGVGGAGRGAGRRRMGLHPVEPPPTLTLPAAVRGEGAARVKHAARLSAPVIPGRSGAAAAPVIPGRSGAAAQGKGIQDDAGPGALDHAYAGSPSLASLAGDDIVAGRTLHRRPS